jgi:hypothetical protein
MKFAGETGASLVQPRGLGGFLNRKIIANHLNGIARVPSRRRL